MYGSEDWLPGEDEIAMRVLYANPGGSLGEVREYADWLEAHGDGKRAEVLRAEMALLAEPDGPDAPALRMLLAQLVDGVNPEWWKTFRRGAHLYNCARTQASGKVRFELECPRTWESLEPTNTSGARHCSGCDSLVYWCDTVEQAEDRARRGDCISLEARLTNHVYREVTANITGRPVFTKKWAERIFGR